MIGGLSSPKEEKMTWGGNSEKVIQTSPPLLFEEPAGATVKTVVL